MGFQLFTSSGTFNPASWGLKAGDMLYILAIGGGGGGSYTSSQGGNGSASSFGSILSAPGGKSTSYNTIAPTIQIGSCLGSRGKQYAYAGDNSYAYGPSGGDGWMPGMTQRMTPSTPQNPGSLSDFYGHVWGVPSGSASASTVARGFGGGSTGIIGGAGGIGYGAGGGGYANDSYSAWGGSSGSLQTITYILPSTATIAVTVGAGGKGHDANNGGGGGASGCVAVYW